MVLPTPSSTRASATEIPIGPATVADREWDKARPSRVQNAPLALQSLVSGSRIVTAPEEFGSTVMVRSTPGCFPAAGAGLSAPRRRGVRLRRVFRRPGPAQRHRDPDAVRHPVRVARIFSTRLWRAAHQHRRRRDPVPRMRFQLRNTVSVPVRHQPRRAGQRRTRHQPKQPARIHEERIDYVSRAAVFEGGDVHLSKRLAIESPPRSTRTESRAPTSAAAGTQALAVAPAITSDPRSH